MSSGYSPMHRTSQRYSDRQTPRNPPNSPSPLTRRAGFLQTSTVRTMWAFRPSPYCDTSKVGPRSMGRPSSRSTRKVTE